MNESLNMDDCYEAQSTCDDNFTVVDVAKIPPIFHDETVTDEVDLFDMTSLNNLILFSHTERLNTSSSSLCSSYVEDKAEKSEDGKLQRLSLAYERLQSMPKVIIQELSKDIRILDISNNEFSNLEFLSEFKNLTTLICDRNRITEKTIIPFLPKLELLWMNHCKITELYPFAHRLAQQCPNLKYLSLMGNPIAPSYLNGGNFYEYLQYRLLIISLFPNLIHLDDRNVTEDQRQEAERVFRRPLVEKLSKTMFPNFIRNVTDKINDFLPNVKNNTVKRERNGII